MKENSFTVYENLHRPNYRLLACALKMPGYGFNEEKDGLDETKSHSRSLLYTKKDYLQRKVKEALGAKLHRSSIFVFLTPSRRIAISFAGMYSLP